jgi:hypothetical protein
MILKIEVDLGDWISEDGSIDDEIQNAIVSGCVKRIASSSTDSIKKKIDNIVVEMAEKKAVELLKEFMDRNILVTDKWGNEKERYENVKEMLEDRFDSFMSQPVDSCGEPLRGECSTTRNTRIKHMLFGIKEDYMDDRFRRVKDHCVKQVNSHFGKDLENAKIEVINAALGKIADEIDISAGVKAKLGQGK